MIWLACNDFMVKLTALSQCPFCSLFHIWHTTFQHQHTSSPSDDTHGLIHTCDSPHTRGTGGCGWHSHSTTVVDHNDTHTHTTQQSTPFLLSFNPHSTCPDLRPQRDCPQLSLDTLCGCHAVRWFTVRSTQIWL